jgi:Cu(I)/Ag(I) efflux system membrane protein CusA/SilA
MQAGMIERLIDFSAHHRFFVVTLAAAAALVGWQSMMRVPLDALPEMSDKQVIIYCQWDRSPDLIDAQVTYPIVSALLGAPRVKSVRGISDFGASFVYVIFDDDADLYWARSRTLEYLSGVLPRLPEGVRAELGPDATSLGWVFQYVLLDRSGTHSLAELRSYQDWYLDYYLKAVPGVAEVATVGGFVRQYQVNVDPNRLRAYGIPIQRVVEALKNANRDVGGKVVESGGAELIVRGLGYVRSTADFEEILVATAEDSTPIRIKDVAQVAVGSDFRRGVTDLDGMGEAVSGIIVMRQGQNALDVIDRVKAKIRQIEPSLPSGVQIVPVYDRSDLIRRSIRNLKSTILEVILTVAVVILLFLWHFPSAVVPLITIPLSVLIAFVPLQLLGISMNIMSLGGIAIAVGALVDAAIVLVEQAHKNLEEWDRAGRREEPQAVIVRAMKQVARPSFFALLVIAVSFLPVLTLQAEEGRLFKPLAYTKSLAMIVAAVLVITLSPALRLLFTRVVRFQFRPSWLCKAANAALVGEIHAEEKHPLNRRIMRLYEPVVEWSLSNKRIVFGAVLVLMAVTVPIWQKLGTEFMPPLDEGALLYMPNTMPGISVTEAQQLLQLTDRTLKQFPEVERVLGKAGRADTATDPAPLSMLETVIILRPTSSWRRAPTWYSSWAPEWAKLVLRHITPDHISKEDLVSQMNEALKLPGVANAWSMPIRGRIDMLTTGIRTPIGIKVAGNSIEQIERIGTEIGGLLPSVKGTRGVFAERVGQGYFVDFRWNRVALARYGITLDEAQAAVQYAIGGENVTVMVEGRERYPVNVRYLRDFRSDLESLGRVLVSAAGGQRQIPTSELAEIRTTSGPTMLRNEEGMLTGYVYIDVSGRDLAGYVDDADRMIRDKLKLPQGYSISWTGQYEAIARMKRRLVEIVPLTLLLIFLLLYLNTRSLSNTLIVLLAVPFSAVGAIWALYLVGYHMSIAVWVGLIALMGVDAETGVFMLLYLDHAYDRAKRANRLNGPAELKQAVLEGAARRVRPKFMTVATMFFGLLPIMWSTGTGSDVMKRIAAPMIGGILTSFVLELIVYPAIYHFWKSRFELKFIPEPIPVPADNP